MSDQKIIVAANLTASVRLDIFLAQRTELSRSQIQKRIKNGSITLNGKTVAPHHAVANGATIEVTDLGAPLREPVASKAETDPVVIFEDANYLVVDKPYGLIVHGGSGVHEPTLADWAVQHDAAIADVGDQPDIRPGIVHRLDKDVSGVMVVAKTQRAFLDLKRQFQNHSITKEYLALANGRLTSPTGRIDFAIARKADHSGLMVARPKSQEGLEAETRFHVERYVKNMTLVRVQTLTGRTHQIRVHFKAIAHPLVGDPLYRIRKLKIAKHTPPRLFLHAERLAFDDLDGQRRDFHAPMPVVLARYLARLS